MSNSQIRVDRQKSNDLGFNPSQQQGGLNSLAIFQSLISNLNNQLKLNNDGSQFYFVANKNLGDNNVDLNPNERLFNNSRNFTKCMIGPPNSNIFIYHLPVRLFLRFLL